MVHSMRMALPETLQCIYSSILWACSHPCHSWRAQSAELGALVIIALQLRYELPLEVQHARPHWPALLLLLSATPLLALHC